METEFLGNQVFYLLFGYFPLPQVVRGLLCANCTVGVTTASEISNTSSTGPSSKWEIPASSTTTNSLMCLTSTVSESPNRIRSFTRIWQRRSTVLRCLCTCDFLATLRPTLLYSQPTTDRYGIISNRYIKRLLRCLVYLPMYMNEV